VLEKDVGLITSGMKAKILTEAYPGKPLRARSFESTRPSIWPRARSRRKSISQPGHLLKPGMFAKIEMVLKANPNALTIPKEAVLRKEEKNSSLRGRESGLPKAGGHRD